MVPVRTVPVTKTVPLPIWYSEPWFSVCRICLDGGFAYTGHFTDNPNFCTEFV